LTLVDIFPLTPWEGGGVFSVYVHTPVGFDKGLRIERGLRADRKLRIERDMGYNTDFTVNRNYSGFLEEL
jgi:hypothetical protein